MAGLGRYKKVLTTSLIFTQERPGVMKRMQRLGAQPTTRLLTALILRWTKQFPQCARIFAVTFGLTLLPLRMSLRSNNRRPYIHRAMRAESSLEFDRNETRCRHYHKYVTRSIGWLFLIYEATAAVESSLPEVLGRGGTYILRS